MGTGICEGDADWIGTGIWMAVPMDGGVFRGVNKYIGKGIDREIDRGI